MSQSYSMQRPDRASSPAATGPRRLSGCIRIMAIWLYRRQGPQDLSELDDHQLKDVAFSREDALREASKPFWKA
jgi:uncharacterized protein YjiS (DUF1127 family)